MELTHSPPPQTKVGFFVSHQQNYIAADLKDWISLQLG